MHIGFRTGGGRGEYEVAGSAGGRSASDLKGWTFFMRWPDGKTRETDLWLDPGDSNKPRLRSLPSFAVSNRANGCLDAVAAKPPTGL
jgi:hypothetical protein